MVSRKNLIILGIFLLAIFLRLYRIEENFIFSGEVGHNFLAIKNAIVSREIPLFGPPTSHPWLSFGPLFYWLMMPLLLLVHFNPLVGGYFGASIAVLVVLANYFVIKRIFAEKVALFSSLLITVSPLWLQFSREARFFSLVLPFIYLLLWALEKKNFFLVGLSLGIMLNFHYTPLIFVPIILSLIKIGHLKIDSQKFINFVAAFLIPSLPILIYDSGHNFQMLKNLTMWLPYRITGFLGLYPKNTVSPSLVRENLSSFYEFFSKSFLPEGNLLTPLFLMLLIVFALKKIRNSLILLWLGWGLTALFIHGAPPLHYFLPLFPLPIIIFSLFLSDLWIKKLGKVIVCGLLFVISFINLNFFFSEKWFFLPQDKIWPGTFYVPYKIQKETVLAIIKDAAGRSYNLSRVGLYDYFEGNYAQNYQYLAWWLGNEPTPFKQKLRYIIVEDAKKVPPITFLKEEK